MKMQASKVIHPSNWLTFSTDNELLSLFFRGTGELFYTYSTTILLQRKRLQSPACHDDFPFLLCFICVYISVVLCQE